MNIAPGLQPLAVPIDSITRWPGNPKGHDLEFIGRLLTTYGQWRPAVAQKSTGRILIGNGMHEAAQQIGATELAVEFLDVDDETAKRIIIADNRASDLGGYDETALATMLNELQASTAGLDLTGFTDEDLDELKELADNITNLDTPELLEDPDAVPEPPPTPVSVPGDVWTLGRHRLLVGDSTNITAVEAMLKGDRADCMWTDPPYGVDYVGKTKDALTISNDGASDLPELLAGAFATATAALKPGAPVYIAHPPGPQSLDFIRAFQEAGWLLRQNLIWVKDSMVLGHSDYHYRHEPILYGFTDPAATSGRLGRGGDRWYGDNAQTSILEVPKPPRNAYHPTMKPVELVTRCLTNSCKPSGIVYEPFGGSGTTLIAAEATGRSARVVELEPRYADVIVRRWCELTGSEATRQDGPSWRQSEGKE